MISLENYKETLENNFFLLKICRVFCPVGEVSGVETYNPHSILNIIYYLETNQIEWNEENIEPLYMCTLCGRCGNVCESYPFSWIIEAARHKAVSTSSISKDSLESLEKRISELIKRKRENLARLDKGVGRSKTLVLAGIYHALDVGETDHLLTLLDKIGIKYDFLGDEEPIVGVNYFDLGFTKKAEECAGETTNIINKYEKVIVLDPAAYFTIKERYPRYGYNVRPKVEHITQALSRELDANTLPSKLSETIALSDPCELVRSETLKPTRDLLYKLKISFIEPQYSGELSYPTGGCGSFVLKNSLLANMITEKKLAMIYESTKANTILTVSVREKLDFDNVLDRYKGNINIITLGRFLAEYFNI